MVQEETQANPLNRHDRYLQKNAAPSVLETGGDRNSYDTIGI